jgi:hypothetical protein
MVWMGWPSGITHRGVREVIERRRDDAERAVAPIGRHLTKQVQTIASCLHLFEVGGVRPDWSVVKPEQWMLTGLESMAIEQVKRDLRAVIEDTASELRRCGVGLDEGWELDLVAVGQLLLLDVDWGRSAQELAEDLQVASPAAWSADARSTQERRRNTVDVARQAASLRVEFEHHLVGPRRRATYADGGTRALPEPTHRLRGWLRQVLEEFPKATASQISTTFYDRKLTFGGKAVSPGGYLRQLMESARAVDRMPVNDQEHLCGRVVDQPLTEVDEHPGVEGVRVDRETQRPAPGDRRHNIDLDVLAGSPHHRGPPHRGWSTGLCKSGSPEAGSSAGDRPAPPSSSTSTTWPRSALVSGNHRPRRMNDVPAVVLAHRTSGYRADMSRPSDPPFEHSYGTPSSESAVTCNRC